MSGILPRLLRRTIPDSNRSVSVLGYGPDYRSF